MQIAQPLVLAAALVANACICGHELIRESTSPGGEYVASVLERNCGATTDYVTVVVLRNATEPLNPSNVVFSLSGVAEIGLRWDAPSHLVIERPLRKDRIMAELPSSRGVVITYVTTPDPDYIPRAPGSLRAP